VCRVLALRWNVLPRQHQLGPSHNLDEFIVLRIAYKYKSSLRCTGTGSRIPLLLNFVVIPNVFHVLRPQTDTERRRLFWLSFSLWFRAVLCFVLRFVLIFMPIFVMSCYCAVCNR
jgi:hypothetical protein